MSKLLPVAFMLTCLALTTAGAQQTHEEKLAETKGQEFVHYRVVGRRPYEMTIGRDGAVTVLFETGREAGQRDSFRIGADEVAALEAAVATVDFFSLPERSPRRAGSDFAAHLRITSQGKTRTVVYSHLPELGLLHDLLWKAIQQGVVLRQLRVEQNAHLALCAVNPRLTGSKVLDPRALEEPLRALAATTRAQLTPALEALSYLLTEDQWLGFLWRQLTTGDPDRTTLVLRVISDHPFYANIPKTHVKPICVLLTHQLRGAVANYAALPEERCMALRRAIRFLGEQRHKDAIPVLAKAAVCGYLECAGAVQALYRMVPDGLDPLEGLLDNPDNEIRRAAAVALGDLLYQSAVRTGPGAPTKEQQHAILERLRTTTAAKLRGLAAHDRAFAVREAAKKSLERIEKGWTRLAN
jgi:hypothetical protein